MTASTINDLTMSTRNVTKKAWLGIALGSLLIIGAGCAKQPGAPTPAAPDAVERQDAAQVKQDEVAKGQDAAMEKQDAAQAKQDAAVEKKDDVAMAPKEVKILAKQFSFSPAEIRVKQGEKVRLVVTSEDVSHGLTIPAFNVSLTLEPGKTATAEFVADQKGSFPFFCSVFCGSGHGSMRGTLIVE